MSRLRIKFSPRHVSKIFTKTLVLELNFSKLAPISNGLVTLKGLYVTLYFFKKQKSELYIDQILFI